jgi:hypothetical protein
MIWATRHEPHLDRCASIWLIKRFIDQDASFVFINREEAPPMGAIPFVLPRAEINPIEGVSTAFDALVANHSLNDPSILRIGSIIHDYEVDSGEDIDRLKVPEANGLIKVVRGLARVSKSDHEIVERALVIFDSLYAQLASETTHRAPQ